MHDAILNLWAVTECSNDLFVCTPSLNQAHRLLKLMQAASRALQGNPHTAKNDRTERQNIAPGRVTRPTINPDQMRKSVGCANVFFVCAPNTQSFYSVNPIPRAHDEAMRTLPASNSKLKT
jgi:hypothetical protein